MENSSKNTQVNEVNLSKGIELPWNDGWAPGISTVPGLPLKFSYDDQGIALIITADGADLIKRDNGKILAVNQPVLLSSGDTIYWQMGNAKTLSQKDDVHYVDVLIREQDHLVGYAIIRIQKQNTATGASAYFADVLKNAFYPKTDNGQYQTISESYVREKIQEVKGKA
jgi:hypothetical protein